MSAVIHVATAAVVKVSLGANGGNRVARFVQRGDILPEGVDSEQLERLTARGLIAPVEVEVELVEVEVELVEPGEPVEVPAGDPAPVAKPATKPATK